MCLYAEKLRSTSTLVMGAYLKVTTRQHLWGICWIEEPLKPTFSPWGILEIYFKITKPLFLLIISKVYFIK